MKGMCRKDAAVNVEREGDDEGEKQSGETRNGSVSVGPTTGTSLDPSLEPLILPTLARPSAER